MIVAALDLATKTGVAIGSPRREPLMFTEDLGEGFGKCAAVMRLIHRIVTEYAPTEFVIEKPILAKMGFGHSIAHQHRIFGAAVGAIILHKTPVREFSVQQIRSHFIAHMPKRKGHAKQQVLEACRALGWKPGDDNQADAAALFDLRCSQLDPVHGAQTTGLFHGSTA